MLDEGMDWEEIKKKLQYGDKGFSPPKKKSAKAWGAKKARGVFYAKLRKAWIRHDIADMLPQPEPAEKKKHKKPKKLPKKAKAKKKSKRAG
jgi:hypothetical protein